MIYPYLGFMAVSIGAYLVQQRGGWQRRYLDYRVLAEALRVQFYWAVAGVDRPAASRFGHDAFLKRHLELGWIRNMLRVAGRRDDASDHAPTESGIEIASRDWIGDDEHGQLSYYSRRWPQLLGPLRLTETLQRFSFGAGLVLAAALAFAQWAVRHSTGQSAVCVDGVAADHRDGVRHVHAAKCRGRYDPAVSVHGARHGQRPAPAPAHDQRRTNGCRILRELGDAALREHSQWILRKRERPISTVS